MAIDEKKRCGAHTELAKNAASRITRCACGQVHVHVMSNGVTLQLSAENFGLMGAAMSEATESLQAFSDDGMQRTQIN